MTYLKFMEELKGKPCFIPNDPVIKTTTFVFNPKYTHLPLVNVHVTEKAINMFKPCSLTYVPHYYMDNIKLGYLN